MPEITVAQVGKPAPDFKAKAVHRGQFADIDLADYRGQFVILLFYPLDFTFVCPTELIAFSDRYQEFSDLNAVILGISVDSEYAHLAWTQAERHKGGVGSISYPLLSDQSKQISRAFNVLNEDNVALRGLFIIDQDGILQHATINNLSFGRSVDEALRVMQAIQFTQQNGEVCPVNWHPGDKTMAPDPQKSLEYFEHVTDHINRREVNDVVAMLKSAGKL